MLPVVDIDTAIFSNLSTSHCLRELQVFSLRCDSSLCFCRSAATTC